MIALAGTMKHGITMVMRNKFSASQYWVDCVKYRVTVSLFLSFMFDKQTNIFTALDIF